MDDTLAKYDPIEAVTEISEETGLDPRTVAQVLEAEMDYLGCLGFLDEAELDDDEKRQLEAVRRENADLLDASEGEYDSETAAAFIQRNRGIDKDTINRVLQANYRFMDERGLLDDWEGTEQ